jgi:hypothetical protein
MYRLCWHSGIFGNASRGGGTRPGLKPIEFAHEVKELGSFHQMVVLRLTLKVTCCSSIAIRRRFEIATRWV